MTAATLRLVPAVADRATGWLAVASPAAALRILRAMEARSADAIESFELVPGGTLDLVLKHIPDTRAPLSGAHPWLVLVEYVAAGDGQGAHAALEALMQDALTTGLAQDAVLAASEAQAEAFWRVPVDAMPDFIVGAARQVEAAFPGVHASAFGHLGDGNVHFHVNAPTGADPTRWRQEVGEPASRFVYDLVTAAGGSISAEHGIGQMKCAELERQSSPARMGVLRGVKAGLDPRGLMNPGKLLRNDPAPHKASGHRA